MTKLDQLYQVAGDTDVNFTSRDIQDDFDPGAYDSMMKVCRFEIGLFPFIFHSTFYRMGWRIGPPNPPHVLRLPVLGIRAFFM